MVAAGVFISCSTGRAKSMPTADSTTATARLKNSAVVTDTRTALEVLGAREAALRITPEQVEDLRKINRSFLEQKETGFRGSLDNDFHIAIARISGNPCLVEYIQNLLMRQALIAAAIPMQPQRVPYAYEEHEAIIRGLELRDPELAAKQADIHFHMSQKSLQNKLQKYLETK